VCVLRGWEEESSRGVEGISTNIYLLFLWSSHIFFQKKEKLKGQVVVKLASSLSLRATVYTFFLKKQQSQQNKNSQLM